MLAVTKNCTTNDFMANFYESRTMGCSLLTWIHSHNPLKFSLLRPHYTHEMKKVKPRVVILLKVAQLLTSGFRAGSLKQVCVMLKSAFLCKMSMVFLTRISMPACGKEGVFLICFCDSSPPAACAMGSGSLLASIL